MINIYSKIDVVIIPVAGLGTRFYPITKVIPKTMLPIINKPTLQYIIEEVVESGVEEIIIVMNENQQSIVNFFDSNFIDSEKSDELKKLKRLCDKIKINYVIQPRPLGIGDAIIRCKKLINNRDFGLVLGDDIIYKNNKPIYGIGSLILKYQQNKASYVGIKKVLLEETKKYGIVQINEGNKITNIREKPKINPPSNYAIIGRYIFENKIIDYLEKLDLDNESEIKITDAINEMCKVENIYASQIEGIRYDVGDYTEYVIANIEYALNNKIVGNKIIEYIKNKLQNTL